MTLAKQRGSLDRIAKHPHRLIGRGRPLHCNPKIAVRRGCKAIRVHDALHLAIAAGRGATLCSLDAPFVKAARLLGLPALLIGDKDTPDLDRHLLSTTP